VTPRAHVANIGEGGARRRRLGGYVWGVVALITVIVLAVLHAPRWTTLLLAIPIALSSLGFLQAREKT
jgi:hypothetical protein